MLRDLSVLPEWTSSVRGSGGWPRRASWRSSQPNVKVIGWSRGRGQVKASLRPACRDAPKAGTSGRRGGQDPGDQVFPYIRRMTTYHLVETSKWSSGMTERQDDVANAGL
jgi:hypothetical protein